MKEEIIRILVVPANEEPRIMAIQNDLRTCQEVVGGYIQTFPLDSVIPNPGLGAIAILNDEGKITDGVKPNRSIFHKEKIFDVFYGRFFICSMNGEHFGSITPEQEKYYKTLFANSSLV